MADKPLSTSVLEKIDVAPVWSVHHCGNPELLTSGRYQYVAYYDAERVLTLSQRTLDTKEWSSHRFPVQMGWQTGDHAKLSIAIDRDGYIHLSCYRRKLLQAPEPPPMALYYLSTSPHSIEAFEHLHMISPEEQPHYPTYYHADNALLFAYRDGGSGKGNQLLNRYDPHSRTWSQALGKTLIDGEGERSAYVHRSGPFPGPDGCFHLLWVWRDTPDHETNHSLSYARTVGDDLTQWESHAGVPVAPPFTIEDRELLVDATPPEGGLSNVLRSFTFDSKDRVVISYHKFDEKGFSQMYNARFQDGDWHIVQATDWDFIWGDAYTGRGALGIYQHLRMSNVHQGNEGELTQQVWNRDQGGATLVLDEETLRPLRVEDPEEPPAWKKELMHPLSDFQVEPNPRLRRMGGPMEVHLIQDKGQDQPDGVDFYLRWENAGGNRDRPVPKPWPEANMLTVYGIQAESTPTHP